MTIRALLSPTSTARPSLSLSPRRRAFLCRVRAGAGLHQREHFGAAKAQRRADVHRQQDSVAGQAPDAGAAQAQHLLDLRAGEKDLRIGKCGVWVHRRVPRETPHGAGTRGTASTEKQFSRPINIDDNVDDKRADKRKSQSFSRTWDSIWRKRWNSSVRQVLQWPTSVMS